MAESANNKMAAAAADTVNKNKTILVSLEGNIGTGKSTLLEEIQQNYIKKGYTRICFLPEPVEVWNTIRDENNITMLEKYYDDQKKYAFSFQMMAYISRLTSLRAAVKTGLYDLILTERSLFTDREVFARMLYDDKKIEQIEYTIYLKWFDDFIADLPPVQFIYLQSDPGVAFQRVKKRARQGESNISLAYLENCHQYHEQWLIGSNSYQKNPLLRLNSNLELADMLDEWLKVIDLFLPLEGCRPQNTQKDEYTYYS